MKYTESHEWIDKEGFVGISEYGQRELGDVVYVQLPKVGQKVKAGDEVAVLESTKAASDIYSPVSGKILSVNEKLIEDPKLINRSAEEKGWLFKIEVQDTSELDSLLEHEQYRHLILD